MINKDYKNNKILTKQNVLNFDSNWNNFKCCPVFYISGDDIQASQPIVFFLIKSKAIEQKFMAKLVSELDLQTQLCIK